MARSVSACSLFGLLVVQLCSLGCSPSTGSTSSSPSSIGGHGNAGSSSHVGGSTSHNTNTSSAGGAFQVTPISEDTLAGLVKSCGNSLADNDNEKCDDGNKVGGDGCSVTCQLENPNEWNCPRTGACSSTAICGDGHLSSQEVCDDKNQNNGDGCSSDCKTVEDGWQCRVPGKDCMPICGDGTVIEGHELCDDNNTDNGDGCSNTCLVEPGYTCSGGKCTKSVCGNGKQEGDETCDAGELNGLFYGNGTGCSKTCTQEPSCRDDSGKTQACVTRCGDGNIDADRNETCDDANTFDGDGCSSDCKKEDGFICDPVQSVDTASCTDGGKCLILPIVFRDFDGQQVASGGHPDFFYIGSGTGSAKTVCVPNASGREPGTSGSCSGNDSTPLCLGLVNSKLDANGKPSANTSRSGGLTCDCRFTDWDKTGILSGLTGTSTCSSGDSGTITYAEIAGVKVINSADSFKEWYTKTSKSDEYVDQLELAQVGSSNQYQFSSSDGRSVYDDIHDIFLKSSGGTVPAGAATSLSSGFFPDVMEASTTKAKVCNLWPYWSAATNCVGTQWDARANSGSGSSVASVAGKKRNFYFTSEVRYLFRYAGGESLEFYGDDDVYVFINGVLVLDLGAPHERLKGTVTLTDANTATATINALDVATGAATKVGTQKTTALGLVKDKTYEIAIFHADRHPRESNYQLTLFGFSTTKSQCKAECGNGVKTMGEECDDGDANSDTAYNGCTTDCKYGPFCGDGTPDPDEACDHGRDNGDTYGKDGCTGDCQIPHFCGDGFIDGLNGEECDTQGATSTCDKDCKVIYGPIN